MTSDRESRGVFAVILAVAAILIWVNLAVNPAGLPDWAGMVALILAAGAAGLWALSWRQSVTETAEEEPEPVVITLGGTTPPAVALPVPVHVPDPVVETVVGKVEAVAPIVEAPTAPEPEKEAIGDAPVIEAPTPVVEAVAEAAPEAPAVEVQKEAVIAEATAAPETAPTPPPPAHEPAAVVEKEEVIAQAAVAPVVEPEPTPAVTEKSEPDDFTKIEGIGKYYRDALHKLGITTFAQLAQETDAKALVERLKANGFRQHASIETWAEQAALAAAGDWAALEALQATLDGGRRTEG